MVDITGAVLRPFPSYFEEKSVTGAALETIMGRNASGAVVRYPVFSDRATAQGATVGNNITYLHTEAYSTSASPWKGGALYRLAANDTEYNNFPTRLKFTTSDSKKFVIAEQWPNPQQAGAVGDGATDDFAALQAWADFFKLEDWSHMPGDNKYRSGAINLMDGCGLSYATTDTVVLTSCHGGVFCNISVLAIGNGWASSDPIVYADLTYWLRFPKSCHFQSNWKCSGPDFQRCWGLDFAGRAWGNGKGSWGVRIGPQDYSVSARVDGASILGCLSNDHYAVSGTENFPPSARTADGLVVNAVDVSVVGATYIGLYVKPVHVTGGGFHFTGNHIYNGWPGAEDDSGIAAAEIGIYVDNSNGGCIISDNQFDHCCVYVVGQASRKKIHGNIFYAVPESPVRYMVVLEATAANQSIYNFECSKNSGHGPFTHAVRLIESGGDSYYRVGFSVVEGNFIEYYDDSPVSQQYPTSLGWTRGMARYSFNSAGDFDGNNHIALDLAPYILPVSNNDADFPAVVSLQLFDGTNTNTTYLLWSRIDFSTKLLHVKLSAAPSSGRLNVWFDMGQTGPLTAN